MINHVKCPLVYLMFNFSKHSNCTRVLLRDHQHGHDLGIITATFHLSNDNFYKKGFNVGGQIGI